MSNDTERYKLCLQCIRDEGAYASVERMVRIRIATGNVKWENPWFAAERFAKDEIDVMKEPSEVCVNCPYKLEHIVFAGKEVHEQR